MIDRYWARLGLQPGAAALDIKRAYARELKRCRPDEDAQAYQQLREAYEYLLVHVLQQANSPFEAQADISLPSAPSSAEPTAADADAAPVVADDPVDLVPDSAWAALSELVERVRQRLIEAESSTSPELWSMLQYELDRLPLSMHAQASVQFADLMLEGIPVPDVLIGQLADYFQWRSDYRSQDLLDEQACAIEELLDRIGWVHSRDPHVWRRHERLLSLLELIRTGQRGRARWLASLSSSKVGEHLRHASRPLLRALGVEPRWYDDVRESLFWGGWIRLALLLVLLLPCAALLVEAPDHHLLQHWAIAGGIVIAARLCRHLRFCVWLQWVAEMGHQDLDLHCPAHISWWLVLLPLAVAINLAIIQVVQLHWLKAFFCAAIWILAAHLVLSMWIREVLAFYTSLVNSQIRSRWSRMVQMVLGTGVLLVCLPLNYMVLAKVRGVRSALTVMGLALALASMRPGSVWLLPVSLILMPLLAECVQRGMDRLAQARLS